MKGVLFVCWGELPKVCGLLTVPLVVDSSPTVAVIVADANRSALSKEIVTVAGVIEAPLLFVTVNVPPAHMTWPLVHFVLGITVGPIATTIGVGVGVGLIVILGVIVKVGVAVMVTTTVGVIVMVAVIVGVAVMVGVAVIVGVAVTVGVAVMVSVAVVVGVAVMVGVAVIVGARVGVTVGVAVGPTTPPNSNAPMSQAFWEPPGSGRGAPR